MMEEDGNKDAAEARAEKVRRSPAQARNPLLRRRRTALASLYLLLFALLAALSLSSPSGWMPGPLSAEHMFTGDRCETCHAPWGDVESRCVNCHENTTLDKGWREHRGGDLGGATGDSLPAGLISRTVGATGITALAGAASGIVVALAIFWGRFASSRAKPTGRAKSRGKKR